MNGREQLLKQLSAEQFAMWELHVFLDTHVDDPEAIRCCKQHSMEYEKLRKEYEEKFGPLTAEGCVSEAWIQDPWPWDNIKEGC